MTCENSLYVQLGPRRWKLGGEYLKPLEASNQCLQAENIGLALKNELDAKGYLYLKKVLPEEDVFKARLTVLEYIQQLNDRNIVKKPVFSSSYVDGVLSAGCDVGCLPFMEGKNSITSHPSVLNIIESPFLYDLFTRLFNGIRPVTFDYKWLRGMHHGGNTGCHLDRVYMNRGSSKLLTCWIPFDNLSLDMSVLAVLEGSHRTDRTEDDGYAKLQNTYANMDVERDQLQGTGWFTEDPMEFYYLNDRSETKVQCEWERSYSKPIWKTTAYSAGDVLIFTMRTIHMSSVNLTDKVRLSCDTRWQPSDEPADPRYFQLEQSNAIGHGENKFGLHATNVDKIEDGKTTMEQWRKKWGFVYNVL